MLELVRNKARRNLLLLLKSRQPGNVPTRQTLKMNVKCQPCPSDRITRLGAPLAAVASRIWLSAFVMAMAASEKEEVGLHPFPKSN